MKISTYHFKKKKKKFLKRKIMKRMKKEREKGKELKLFHLDTRTKSPFGLA